VKLKYVGERPFGKKGGESWGLVGEGELKGSSMWSVKGQVMSKVSVGEKPAKKFKIKKKKRRSKDREREEEWGTHSNIV